MNPTAIDCEILDWLSRRPPTRWSLIPPHWRRRLHTIVAEPEAHRWAERIDVRLVQLTPLGRSLAAAYRHGRSALAPGQREFVAS